MHIFSYSTEALGLSHGTSKKSSKTLKLFLCFYYLNDAIKMINTKKNQVMLILMHFPVQEMY